MANSAVTVPESDPPFSGGGGCAHLVLPYPDPPSDAQGLFDQCRQEGTHGIGLEYGQEQTGKGRRSRAPIKPRRPGCSPTRSVTTPTTQRGGGIDALIYIRLSAWVERIAFVGLCSEPGYNLSNQITYFAPAERAASLPLRKPRHLLKGHQNSLVPNPYQALRRLIPSSVLYEREYREPIVYRRCGEPTIGGALTRARFLSHLH